MHGFNEKKTHTLLHMQTYIHTHTCIHTNTHTQTHTHTIHIYIEGLECKGVKSKKVSFEKTEKM